MTDEERDFAEFQAYLTALPPEGLWDIQAHLDAERYPRRSEAVRREMERRRLFYVSPYTAREARLRSLFGLSFAAASLAASLRGIASIRIDLLPGERLTFFYDLAAGGPKAARMVLPLTCFVSVLLAAAAGVGVLLAAALLARRRLRPDVFVTGVVALTLAAGLLRFAFS